MWRHSRRTYCCSCGSVHDALVLTWMAFFCCDDGGLQRQVGRSVGEDNLITDVSGGAGLLPSKEAVASKGLEAKVPHTYSLVGSTDCCCCRIQLTARRWWDLVLSSQWSSGVAINAWCSVRKIDANVTPRDATFGSGKWAPGIVPQQ